MKQRLISTCSINTLSGEHFPVLYRSAVDYDALVDFTVGLDLGSYSCVFTDKGLVGDDFVSEFEISPDTSPLRSLGDELHRLEVVSSIPDFSHC